MVEAYFDESGIHEGARVCVVAGFYGRANAWRQLEREWRKILQSHQFPLEKFHAKDILKQTRHRAMVNELGDSISKCSVFPISAGVVIQDFKELHELERKWFTGGGGKARKSGAPSKPYFLPFQLCITQVTRYTPIGARAHFFFGCDRPFAEYAVTLFKQIKESGYSPNWQEKARLGDVHFPQAKETPQLQAADLFSHLSYIHFLERQAENNWNVTPGGVLAKCLTRTKSRYDHVFTNKKCFTMTLDEAFAQHQAHYELKVKSTA